MATEKSHNLSLFSLRLGLGLVFVIFGFDKLPNPTNWIVYIPAQMPQILNEYLNVSIYDFFRWQGMLELVIGAQLIFGFLTRFWAGLSSFLLASIIFVLDFDHIGIRDLGLFFMALALIFSGAGRWSMDSFLQKNGEGQRQE